MIEGTSLPTLGGDRVELRWLTARDAPSIFELFSHSDVARFWSSPAYTEISQAEALIEEIHELFDKKSLYQWGVVHRASQKVIGTCTLASLDQQSRRAEVGFALHPEFWKQGLMSEALGVLIGFAFEDLDLHRLEADVDPRNEASLVLLERFGFEREGYLRERWIVGDEITDSVLLGLLAVDWRQRQLQEPVAHSN